MVALDMLNNYIIASIRARERGCWQDGRGWLVPQGRYWHDSGAFNCYPSHWVTPDFRTVYEALEASYLPGPAEIWSRRIMLTTLARGMALVDWILECKCRTRQPYTEIERCYLDQILEDRKVFRPYRRPEPVIRGGMKVEDIHPDTCFSCRIPRHMHALK